ncbi:MAG TPA: DUF2993 domain-containing protein [Actinophytocola sp.]|uniref:LmeA family phospholipid-binding protein n=1 Tax=Actinophytocola sp. TaxID=1872138 RepID=UPI002DBA33EA|nr:DUF2993 domain-containing protein [Actinophytocola sp.]HEU5474130.1 DUF2993 domain-containing protein [Actinophytocola sp.]
MSTMTDPYRTPVAPKRRSRALRRLVITLVVLVGLLVIADFAAAAIFEHEVSKRARAEFNLADDPKVNVHGFSFLAQAISGEYDQVTVEAEGVPVQDLRDVDVSAELYGVRAPLSDLISGSAKQVTVREVEGTVTLKESDVNRAIRANENDVVKTFNRVSINPMSEAQVADPNAKPPPADVEAEEAKKDKTTAGTRICATAELLGTSTDLCVFGIISLGEQEIGFDPRRLEVRDGLSIGTLDQRTQSVLLSVLAFKLPTGVLPFQVTPTNVTVSPGQLSVTGKAQEVTLGGGSTG